jgi:hypothetical protein
MGDHSAQPVVIDEAGDAFIDTGKVVVMETPAGGRVVSAGPRSYPEALQQMEKAAATGPLEKRVRHAAREVRGVLDQMGGAWPVQGSASSIVTRVDKVTEDVPLDVLKGMSVGVDTRKAVKTIELAVAASMTRLLRNEDFETTTDAQGNEFKSLKKGRESLITNHSPLIEGVLYHGILTIATLLFVLLGHLVFPAIPMKEIIVFAAVFHVAANFLMSLYFGPLHGDEVIKELRGPNQERILDDQDRPTLVAVPATKEDHEKISEGSFKFNFRPAFIVTLSLFLISGDHFVFSAGLMMAGFGLAVLLSFLMHRSWTLSSLSAEVSGPAASHFLTVSEPGKGKFPRHFTAKELADKLVNTSPEEAVRELRKIKTPALVWSILKVLTPEQAADILSVATNRGAASILGRHRVESLKAALILNKMPAEKRAGIIPLLNPDKQSEIANILSELSDPTAPRSNIGPLRIAMVATELSGFAKFGSLGDFMDGLSQELAGLGHEVTVYMPYFKGNNGVNPSSIPGFPDRALITQEIDMGPKGRKTCRIWSVKKGQVTVKLIENDEYFNTGEIYSSRLNAAEAERFIFFDKAVVKAMSESGPAPDVVQTNDEAFERFVSRQFLSAYGDRFHRPQFPLFRNFLRKGSEWRHRNRDLSNDRIASGTYRCGWA